uniref:Glutathione peroxidase n=1 Tax=Heterorhabditis bacteriophora TaxID=37862 RepID=A0A1I7XS31_HETBA
MNSYLLYSLFITLNIVNKSTALDDDMSAHKTIYEGQVVIIVNVASQCGFTNNHYKELKELQDKYYDEGLRVAAFPCNQFGGQVIQEPACELDISNFIKTKFDYEPDLYAKVNVNGANAHPLWQFLQKEQSGLFVDAIKWNFTKFLIDREGHVVKRFGPTTSPSSLASVIKHLLSEPL